MRMRTANCSIAILHFCVTGAEAVRNRREVRIEKKYWRFEFAYNFIGNKTSFSCFSSTQLERASRNGHLVFLHKLRFTVISLR
jgi:hypothetical protein